MSHATPKPGDGQGQGSTRFQIVLALAFGVAALTTAFAAYQAELRSGDSLKTFQEANTATAEANDSLGQGDTQRALDQQIFVQYSQAINSEDAELARFLRNDLSPDLLEAMRKWEKAKTDEPTPFSGDDPAYVLEAYGTGQEFQKQADAKFAKANELRRDSDSFTLVTVFLASALFLFGIASVTKRLRIKHALAIVGAVILTGSIVGLLGLMV